MYIAQIHIEKLWGNTSFSIDLNPDVNFLIGVNGSGKTTVIALLAALLQGDISAIGRVPFSKAKLVMRSLDGEEKDILIEVIQEVENEEPFTATIYQIRQARKTLYKMHFPRHDYYQHAVRSPLRGPPEEDYFRRTMANASEEISKFALVSWLNVNRANQNSARASERFESSVDRKLEHLGAELLRYFSEIESAVRIEREQFQRQVFLKLIRRSTEPALFHWLGALDLGAEKNSIQEILTSFGIDKETYQRELNDHFKTLNALAEPGREQGMNFKQLEALIAMQHLHGVVQDWEEFSQKKKAINRAKDALLSVLNELMPTKKFEIDKKNELVVILKPTFRKRIALSRLSSGEKQLVILTGQALLQRGKPCIYIADEPELSLHVTWQEKLTQVIRLLNPNAQIIFATHSPDIVSTYTSNTFDMEKIIHGPGAD